MVGLKKRGVITAVAGILAAGAVKRNRGAHAVLPLIMMLQ